VTTSEVDVVVTERENDVIYQCHGTNEALGQTVVDTITLEVMCELIDVTLLPLVYMRHTLIIRKSCKDRKPNRLWLWQKMSIPSSVAYLLTAASLSSIRPFQLNFDVFRD